MVARLGSELILPGACLVLFPGASGRLLFWDRVPWESRSAWLLLLPALWLSVPKNTTGKIPLPFPCLPQTGQGIALGVLSLGQCYEGQDCLTFPLPTPHP